MRRVIAVLIVLISFSSCQEQDKVAFIDNGKVINDYQMKIDIEERFKVKDEAFKKKTDSIGQAFQIEAQAFNLAAAKMSKKAQQEKYQELGQKQQVLQQQIMKSYYVTIIFWRIRIAFFIIKTRRLKCFL